MSDEVQHDEGHSEALVDEVLQLVDSLLATDTESVVALLNAEIARVQSRYTVLCAIRDSLLPDAGEEAVHDESTELPLAEQSDDQPSPDSLERLIVDYVTSQGPSMPAEIGRALSVHPIKVGKVATRSDKLEYLYIKGRGRCIQLAAE